MAEDAEDKPLPATAKRLSEARAKGDIPISREGSTAASYLAALSAVMMLGGITVQKIGTIILPLIDQPDAFLDLNGNGLRAAGSAVFTAVALAVAPIFGLLIAGAILPHVLQNSVVVSTARLMPNLGNLSPMRGINKLFTIRHVIEFAKSTLRAAIVAGACYLIVRPYYQMAPALIGLDLHGLMPLMAKGLISVFGAATLIAVVIAVADLAYQRWSYARRMRMTHEEVKDEAKQANGNPEVKRKIRKMQMQRAARRMMQDVPKASVVITNPTHFAVALRYERGKDAAPVVLAKGLDLVAQHIKQVARDAGVPLIEDRPLARALYASVEIGQSIPREHFEAVAKIIGLIWAQRQPRAGNKPAK